MNSLKQYLDIYDSERTTIDAHSCEALNRLRPAAREALQKSGLPSLHSEGHIVTSPADMFAPDYGLNLTRLPMPADAATAFRCGIPNLSTLKAFVINDSFHAPERLAELLPQGVTVCSLREGAGRFPDEVGRCLGNIAPLSDPSVALNTLLAQDGVMIHIAAGTHVARPLQLVNILASPVAMLAVRRVLIVVGDGAEATVLACDHTQSSGLQVMASQVTEIALGRGAKLDYYDMESSSAETTRQASLYVTQADDSTFNAGVFTLSCGQTRNDLRVDVSGTHCHTFIGGLAIASGSQRVDNNSRIDHTGERSHSRQLFKYVLDDEARGGFEGRILVAPQARYIEAYQSNRNMLASTEARMHTEPQLEIYCDEVKCSHGATTGQLDADQLFYMRTRGIPLATARVMLIQAFMSEVVETVKTESLRDRLHHLVERRLQGSHEKCDDCAAHCNTHER